MYSFCSALIRDAAARDRELVVNEVPLSFRAEIQTSGAVSDREVSKLDFGVLMECTKTSRHFWRANGRCKKRN